MNIFQKKKIISQVMYLNRNYSPIFECEEKSKLIILNHEQNDNNFFFSVIIIHFLHTTLVGYRNNVKSLESIRAIMGKKYRNYKKDSLESSNLDFICIREVVKRRILVYLAGIQKLEYS